MNALEIYEIARGIGDPEARRRYLDEACRNDVGLRSRVEAMLDVPDGTESFLRQPVLDVTSTLDPESRDAPAGGSSSSPRSAPPDHLVGAVVGGVLLERVVGQGGMGKVYVGTQASTGGVVAVKLLMPHVVSDAMLKRFDLEARLLARLRHPGIAQIHSAGTYNADGATFPYFVMEYIADAMPITDYAESQRIDTAGRLELFRKACEAVAYGHEHGVIHRDLKPANILVDSYGQPKVIDFGVAKSTDADLTMTTLTADGAIIGTLRYMSPEQVDGDQSQITIRSDIHALGVILYELLAGELPFDFKNAPAVGVMQIIKSQDPKPLSVISRAFRGDLDAIAAKCLEKDKRDRYASAGDLEAEIARYLAGEPILTRPLGFVGGLARLARKHKAAAAAAMGVFASLLAAVVGISLFAVHAERSREEAERQRRLASDARDAEARQRGVAERAQAVAEQETLNTKRQLYKADLYRLQSALESPHRGLAHRLFRETSAVYASAYGADRRQPVELSLLGPEIDQSFAVLSGHEHWVTWCSFSPDGTRLATSSLDQTARIWDVASGQAVAVLRGHDAQVMRAVFSPDGKLVATCSLDKTARLWDATSGEALAVLSGHSDWVQQLAFSPDGTRLATGSDDTTTRLWDVPTRRQVALLDGHDDSVQGVAFSDDGRTLTTRNQYGSHKVCLWDARTGEAIASVEEQEDEVPRAYSPDGARLITSPGEKNQKIRFVAELAMWDTATKERVTLLRGHGSQVNGCAYTPDGARIVTTSSDKTARIWDAATGAPLATLEGHQGPVGDVWFSPDGKTLATSSSDNTVRLWDMDTAKPRAILEGHQAQVYDVAFSSDGTHLVTADGGTVRVWRAATGRPVAVLTGHQNTVGGFAVSPDGNLLATRSNDMTVRFWNTLTGPPPTLLSDPGREEHHVTSAAFSPDGSRLITMGVEGAGRIWDAFGGRPLADIVGVGFTQTGVRMSRDGRSLLTTCRGNDARIWDAATGRTEAVLVGHEGRVIALAYSGDGRRAATGSVDKTARVWDAATGESLAVLDGHEGEVRSVVLGPDGTRLATHCAGDTVRLWDTLSGASLVVFEGHVSPEFTSDGKRLRTFSTKGSHLWDATTGELVETSARRARSGGSGAGELLVELNGREVILVDADTGETVRSLKGHENAVTTVVFSPDGARVATGSRDTTVRLWETATGDEVAVLKGHEAEIAAVAFSPEGTRLVTVSSRGDARLWGLGNGAMRRHRLAASEARARLSPLVDEWFTGDLAGVKAKLAAAQATMPVEDWREASNMVLERASEFPILLAGRQDLTPEACAAVDELAIGLDFRGSSMTRAHFDALPYLHHLQTLDLGSTGLRPGDLDGFHRFKSLRTLDLRGMDAEGSDLEKLGRCHTLESVSLWKSTVADAGARTLLTLPRLARLDLGGTAISDAWLDGVAANPALRHLRIDRTAVGDASVEALAKWGALATLDVTGTAISSEGVAKLRAALPRCSVITDSER